MTTDDDERLLGLLRRTMGSRERLIDDGAVQRVQDRVRARGERVRAKVWWVSGVAVAAAIATVFVWTNHGLGLTDSDKPPLTGLGPVGCGAPEAHIGSGSVQRTWNASTGNPIAVGGGLRFGTPAVSPDQRDFRFKAVSVVIGKPGTPGSPTALRDGVGVVASKNLVVTDSQAPTKGRVVFETDVPGRYPVWVLVDGTCGTGSSISASPVGFVQVDRSVTTACKQIEYDGRRYLLTTSPELGPGRILGTGTGIDCQGGSKVRVRVATVSELNPAAGVNVLYPGLGVVPYHVKPVPDLDVITYRAASSTPGRSQFAGTLSSFGGCVVLIDGGSIRLVSFERDHVTVDGRVVGLLPRFGDQVGYEIFAGDQPFGSPRGLGDKVQFTGTVRAGTIGDLPPTFQVPPSCAHVSDAKHEVILVD